MGTNVKLFWLLRYLVKYFSPHTNVGILRISREEMHIVWGALTFINQLKGRPCIIKVIHTSGTNTVRQFFKSLCLVSLADNDW